MQPAHCILFSGAAQGAEAAFGVAAERQVVYLLAAENYPTPKTS